MVLQAYIHTAVSKLVDLALGVKPYAVLNGGPAGHEPDLPAQTLLQAGRALLATAMDPTSGRLDYIQLLSDPAYQAYRELARSLRGFSPARFETAEPTAFWINLYNALMIDAVLQYDVSRSVMRDPGVFRRAAYNVGNLRYSADDIEHGILRRNRPHPFLRLRPFSSGDPRLQFMVTTFDPRIHFALVCAANSCPPIAFYNGEQLDQQLDLAMRSFLSGGGLHVERDSGTLFLSRIFKWYLGDFGGKTGLLNWLLPLLEDGPVKGETWKIRYIPYDWGLNQVV